MKPLAVILLTLSTLAVAQSPATRVPAVKFTDTTLENGLRVVISEDHFAPVYAIALCYKVGSRDEQKGRTGFAHLFEHMMFKGSENVGPGEHYYTIFTKGGNMNGATTWDRTMFYEELPKNQLDLGLFLEADRMRSLIITKENLDNQRQAVKEERRQAIDNQAYGSTAEKVDDLVYDNFAYKHPVLGTMADLDAATVDDVKQFFKTYYAPNNAVLALAGDLNTEEALAKVKKYFGAIPRQPAPKPVDLTEPDKTEERRARVDDRLARLTRVETVYRIPGSATTDQRAIFIAASILGGGETSRLFLKLVRAEQCGFVTAYVDGRSGPSTLHIVAYLLPGKKAEDVEEVITEEVARLHANAVTPVELERVRLAIRQAIPATRESVLNIAGTLAESAAVYNDPGRVNTDPEARLAITAADIQKAAQKYLKNANRVTVVTGAPAPAPSQNPLLPTPPAPPKKDN